MVRVEIIANNAVQDDILTALDKAGMSSHYTLIPSVHGRGNSAPKRGDHIWPEENFILFLYCEKEESDKIEKAVEQVKLKFPGEGIKFFVLGR